MKTPRPSLAKGLSIGLALALLILAVGSLGRAVFDSDTDPAPRQALSHSSTLNPHNAVLPMPASSKDSKVRHQASPKPSSGAPSQAGQNSKASPNAPESKSDLQASSNILKLLQRARAQRRRGKVRNPLRAGQAQRSASLPGAPKRWRKGPGGQLIPVYEDRDRESLEAAADDISKKRGTLVGRLEVLTKKLLKGYAYDWKQPEEILEVRLFIDGFHVHSSQAMLPRSSAETSSNGDLSWTQSRGFEFKDVAALNDGKKHLVQVFAGSRGRFTELEGSPEILGGNTSPYARIVKVEERTLTGWAGDPDDWTQPVSVEFHFDGQLQSKKLAQVNAPAGFDPNPELNGKWFQFQIPEFDEELSHTLQIFVNDLTPPLRVEAKHSPWPLNKDASEGNKPPIGSIAFVNNEQISGWAFDPDDESLAIEVDIYFDGVFFERQLANKAFPALVHRSDVQNPNHLWVVDVPEQYQDGFEHRISVFAVNQPAGANPELDHSPALFRAEVNNIPSGFVDVVNAQYMGGWAYDADAGAEPVELEIWIDGQLWKVILANLARADLVPVVCPEPQHGWRVDSPEVLKDGGFHVVRVFARNAPEGPKQELSRSPWELGALTPYLGARVTAKDGALEVTRVERDSPAEAAGMAVGDRILQYNSQPASDPVVFDHWLNSRTPGEAITLSGERLAATEPPGGTPANIDTAFQAFEQKGQAGQSPAPEWHEAGAGLRVRFQWLNGQGQKSWFSVTAWTAYPVLGER